MTYFVLLSGHFRLKFPFALQWLFAIFTQFAIKEGWHLLSEHVSFL